MPTLAHQTKTSKRPLTGYAAIQPWLPAACLQQRHAAACVREAKGLSLRRARLIQKVLADRVQQHRMFSQ
ncbi:hypothetical protein ACSS6W_001460 [Trichoderma asperelloides]